MEEHYRKLSQSEYEHRRRYARNTQVWADNRARIERMVFTGTVPLAGRKKCPCCPGPFMGSRHFTSEDPNIEQVTESGCWVWMAQKSQTGYGTFVIPNGPGLPPGVTTGAHRAFYAKVHGVIPRGLVIDHICRVRCCVNPAHLRAVTSQVNALENTSNPWALMWAARGGYAK